MTVALYLRQSLDQTGLAAAVGRQRDEGTALCVNKDWQWVEYLDNDTSAYNLRKPRPNYQAMLTAIRAGEIKGIVCWHPDRLYRHLSDLQELIDVCNEHNVAIETVRGGEVDLTTPMGRLVARILGSVSMGEMEQKSDRQQFMHRQRAKDGRHWWSQRPFGFIKTTDEHGKPGLAELHPTEAPLVREAYEKVLAGASTNSIMQEWNQAGVKTSTGAAWRNQRLRQLLMNPRNAGLRAHTPTKNGKLGKMEIIGKGDWPAIVTEKVYRAVANILTDPARDLFTKNGGRARKHLLVGIAKCGKCGHTVRSGQNRRGTKQYCCHNCHGIGREMAFIDQEIVKLVADRLAAPDAKNLFKRKDIDLTKIRNERRMLNRSLANAEADYNADIITGRQLQAKTDHIQAQLDVLEAQETDTLRADLFKGVIGSKDTHKAFLSRPLDQQRGMIAAMLDITIRPAHKGRKLTEAIFLDVVDAKWLIGHK